MLSPQPDRTALQRLATALAGVISGVLLLFVVAPPGDLSAQERPLVYNEVNVSGQAAGITLEFEDGDRLSVELREGVLLVNGAEAGRYAAGDALDRAWRALLGQAIASDNGGVSRLLASWNRPDGLSGNALAAAETMESRLGSALAPRTSAATGQAGDPAQPSMDPESHGALVDLLIRQPDRAQGLGRLLGTRQMDAMDVRVGSDVRVGADERIEGNLLVVEGDVRVDGRVDGDLLVLGGDLRLGSDARIGGDLRILGGSIRGNRGGVDGSIEELAAVSEPAGAMPTAADIRAEVERGIRDGLRESPTRSTRTARSSGGFFRNLASGVGGLLQTAVSFALLLGIGVGILYFFPRHFEVVARTAAHVPGRSFAVGWAGLLLSPFVWIFGIVFFTATIIGIPVMLLWLPLFWVMLAAAVLFGFLAVSRNLGSWWVNRRNSYQPQGIDTAQPAARLGVGLVLLLVAFAGASILEIGGPLFGIFQVLLVVIGTLLAVNAAALGLGAALLSRAGRDRRWAGEVGDLGLGMDPFGPEDPFDGPAEPFHGPRPAPGSDDDGN
ncbi:MAG: hypothetical protein EA350_11000 [Gemmatimonadales bacterium]|nr:MAG: hypothetical protein EA350_11000 [Gemmatimonadales bacterium]